MITPTILIVEDDPSVHDLIKTVLETQSYDVRSAWDGGEGLKAVKAFAPDIVVLDINMPDLDGFGFLAALPHWAIGPSPAVLVLTARNAVEDVKRCVSLGAKDYLAKPFATEQLLARIRRLERRSAPVDSRSMDALTLVSAEDRALFKRRR